MVLMPRQDQRFKSDPKAHAKTKENIHALLSNKTYTYYVFKSIRFM